MLSNAYFLAKFRFDTAENKPAKKLQNFAKFAPILLTLTPDPRGGAGRDLLHPGREGHGDRGAHRREGHPGSPPGALGDAPAET